jgi:hypothetical protein
MKTILLLWATVLRLHRFQRVEVLIGGGTLVALLGLRAAATPML